MFRQPQYWDGQRVTSTISPLSLKRAQNPTVTLTIVEQDEMPKGQCCSLSLVKTLVSFVFEFRVNERQLSDAANDDKLPKSNSLDDVAMKNGFWQGAHAILIRSASFIDCTAMLSMPAKLQAKFEPVAETRE